jgi:hypothetical protein
MPFEKRLNFAFVSRNVRILRILRNVRILRILRNVRILLILRNVRILLWQHQCFNETTA